MYRTTPPIFAGQKSPPLTRGGKGDRGEWHCFCFYYKGRQGRRGKRRGSGFCCNERQVRRGEWHGSCFCCRGGKWDAGELHACFYCRVSTYPPCCARHLLPELQLPAPRSGFINAACMFAPAAADTSSASLRSAPSPQGDAGGAAVSRAADRGAELCVHGGAGAAGLDQLGAEH